MAVHWSAPNRSKKQVYVFTFRVLHSYCHKGLVLSRANAIIERDWEDLSENTQSFMAREYFFAWFVDEGGEIALGDEVYEKLTVNTTWKRVEEGYHMALVFKSSEEVPARCYRVPYAINPYFVAPP